MSKTRGVRGAAGWCAIAAILYLLARSLLYAGISALVGVVHPGASLVKPIGVSEVGLGLLQIVIAVGAALVPLLWMLRGTRLQTDDLRITVPAPWSPAFCLPVFLGVASTANLCGWCAWPGPRTLPLCCPAAAQSCSCSFWRFAPCPLWWRNCFSAAHCKG